MTPDQIPCINCITFIMCKSRLLSYPYQLTYRGVVRFHNFSILNEYIGDNRRESDNINIHGINVSAYNRYVAVSRFYYKDYYNMSNDILGDMIEDT